MIIDLRSDVQKFYSNHCIVCDQPIDDYITYFVPRKFKSDYPSRVCLTCDTHFNHAAYIAENKVKKYHL